MRSKAHGVTREGKLVQPSVKMEKCPLDWGAEQVSKAKKSQEREFIQCCHLGGRFPVVTRVDICPDQARINNYKSASEAKQPPAGDD